MKGETLLYRIIDSLYTKKGTLAVKYYDVVYILTNPNYVARPCSWSSNWGKLVDKRDRYRDAFKMLGIDFMEGNDAPRGGMEGCFIKLTSKGKRQVRDFAKKYRLDWYKGIVDNSLF